MNDPISEQIKQRRQEKNWTQTQLAVYAGLSSAARVSEVERGLPPGPSIERRLREALGMVIDGPVAS